MNFKDNTDFDLIGLGEVMLRLSPPDKEKILGTRGCKSHKATGHQDEMVR